MPHLKYLVLLFCILCVNLSTARKADDAQPLKLVNGKSNITRYLNEQTWNQLFPNRYNVSAYTDEANPARAPYQDYYSYKAFVAACGKFPQFLSQGDEQMQKRELCAFLANIAQETSGGWASAPGGYFKWGLYYIQEQGCANGCDQYSDTTKKDYMPVLGRSYHGRGPKQLSWNYNYGQFSIAYYGSKDTLLNDPDLVIKDPVTAFSSALWFWMTPQWAKPSCHAVMTGQWTPSAHDSAQGRLPGFGATVNVINGGVECNHPAIPKTVYRYKYYRYFCNYFHVSPGDNIECATQRPFNK